MFSTIGRDELTQHFVSMGWEFCNYKSKQTSCFWFRKGELRTTIFNSGSTTDIGIYNIVIYAKATMMDFYEAPPQWLREGGRVDVDVDVELIKWVKEVEAKWHLSKL